MTIKTINEITKNNTIKSKNIKCNFCNKKINLDHFECKCKKLFCASHKYPYLHDCIFNHKNHKAEHLTLENPVIVKEKIIKI